MKWLKRFYEVNFKFYQHDLFPPTGWMAIACGLGIWLALKYPAFG